MGLAEDNAMPTKPPISKQQSPIQIKFFEINKIAHIKFWNLNKYKVYFYLKLL